MVKAYRTTVSRPDPEREKASSGSGPVTTYKMSPEEMEDHFARTAASKSGVHVSPKHPSIVEPKAEAVDKRKTAKEIDQQEVIRLIAEGLTYYKVEQKVGIPKGTLRYRLKKWGLVGLDQIKAKAMLASVQEPEAHEVQNASLKDYEKQLSEWDSLNRELQQLKLEHLNLKKGHEELIKAHEASVAGAKSLYDRCQELESELAKRGDNDNETQALLLEITAERDKWERAASLTDADYGKATNRIKELEVLLAEMTEDRDNWRQMAQEAEQAVVEMQIEYNNLPSVVFGKDMVNNPSHYTSGGIETIDFIRAKLTPDEFVGYCKGNVIKYLARSNYKGGLEDLRKAGKYIDFAVGNA